MCNYCNKTKQQMNIFLPKISYKVFGSPILQNLNRRISSELQEDDLKRKMVTKIEFTPVTS